MIEDNPTDAELVLRAFKRAHLTNPIKIIGDGYEALDYLNRTGNYIGLKKSHPQLVLLDIDLPGVSGIEILGQIKSSKTLRRIPVVVLTASKHDKNIIECGRLGADNYIIKPVNFENFSRIASALDLQWTLVTGHPVSSIGIG